MNDVLAAAGTTASAQLAAKVADGTLPAAAFAVGEVGRGLVHRWVGGVADATSGRAATTATPFCLASTTKPIATTVLGALVERGTIDLDEPVRQWVPELPRPLHDLTFEPTVRQIVTHMAGLGVHHRFFYDDERDPVPVAEAVRTLARPAFPLGRLWRYSNLGYGVLQLALERASNQPMNELVQTLVFDPLGMTDAGFGGLSGPQGSAVRCFPDGTPYPGYVTDHPPASEGWASIDDLLAFGLAHASRSLLRPETHDLIATPAAPRQSDGGAYALGWVQRVFGEHVLLVHGGRMGGVGAHLTVVPTLGIAIAALANVETDTLAAAVGEVLAACVPLWTPVASGPGWEPEAADPSMNGQWQGLMTVADTGLPASLHVGAQGLDVEVGGTRSRVVMSCARPDLVAGHARLGRPHPLLPDDAVVHLDLVSIDESTLQGALVFAQYPSATRSRQGDAVTAPVLLQREHR